MTHKQLRESFYTKLVSEDSELLIARIMELTETRMSSLDFFNYIAKTTSIDVYDDNPTNS